MRSHVTTITSVETKAITERLMWDTDFEPPSLFVWLQAVVFNINHLVNYYRFVNSTSCFDCISSSFRIFLIVSDLFGTKPWWRHQMETFSALLAICAGNSPVPGKSPRKGQWRGALMLSLICVWINDWVKIVSPVIWDATTPILTSHLWLTPSPLEVRW